MRVRMFAAVVFAFAFVVGTALPSGADIQFIACCFENPEVALWDPASQAWYVSNYGGYTLDQVDRAGDGFIEKLDKNGTDVPGDWVTGLNSPYDMDVFKGKLYVADTSELVVIDVKTAKILRKIKVGNTNEIPRCGR